MRYGANLKAGKQARRLDREDESPLLERWLVCGLIGLVIFSAVAHGVVEPWSVLLFELFCVALFFLWAVKGFRERKLVFVLPSLAWPLLALIGLGLAQAIAWQDGAGVRRSLSFDVDATRSALLMLVCLLLCLVLTATCFRWRERLEMLAKFLPFYGMTLALLAILQHFTWSDHILWLRDVSPGNPFGVFINRDHFAGYMELLLGMPVALIATRYIRGEERFLYAVAAIMMGLATILTLSRGGTISLLAEMIFIAAVSLSLDREHSSRRRQHRPPSSLIGVTAVGLILTAIVSGILWIGAEPVVSRFASNQTFYEARGSIWQDTWLLIRANPLLGTGLGAYETALPKFGLDAGRNGLIAQAHNDYLQVLADSGIVGGLLLIWFLFALGQGIAGALSLRDPLLAGVGLGCGAGAVGMLVHSFFDFNLQLPSHGLLFLCLSTIATRVKAIAAEPVVVTSKPRRAASELVNEVM